MLFRTLPAAASSLLEGHEVLLVQFSSAIAASAIFVTSSSAVWRKAESAHLFFLDQMSFVLDGRKVLGGIAEVFPTLPAWTNNHAVLLHVRILQFVPSLHRILLTGPFDVFVLQGCGLVAHFLTLFSSSFVCSPNDFLLFLNVTFLSILRLRRSNFHHWRH